MDGQFFVFVFNGDLFTLVAFAAPSALVYFKTLLAAWREPDTLTLSLHMMVAAFGITFLASRVLMYFPLNFLFFLLAGPAMARASRPDPLAATVD